MVLASIAIVSTAVLAIAAEECPPIAAVSGTRELVEQMTKELDARAIQVEPPGLPPGDCPVLSVAVTGSATELRVAIADAWGRKAERAVKSAATAATLVESWIRVQATQREDSADPPEGAIAARAAAALKATPPIAATTVPAIAAPVTAPMTQPVIATPPIGAPSTPPTPSIGTTPAIAATLGSAGGANATASTPAITSSPAAAPTPDAATPAPIATQVAPLAAADAGATLAAPAAADANANLAQSDTHATAAAAAADPNAGAATDPPARAPAPPAAKSTNGTEPSAFLWRINAEAGPARDRTMWFGVNGAVCKRFGPFCGGVAVRYGISKESESTIEALANVDVPIAIGPLTLTPGIGAGGGYLSGQERGICFQEPCPARADRFDVPRGFAARLEAHGHLSLRLFSALHLAAGASLTSSPAIHHGLELGDPGTTIFRLQGGIIWGAP